jgi:hypothetical protein
MPLLSTSFTGMDGTRSPTLTKLAIPAPAISTHRTLS